MLTENEKKDFSATEALAWSIAAGADEAVSESAANYFEISKKVAPAVVASVPVSPARTFAPVSAVPVACDIKAATVTETITSLQELRQALLDFNECALKATAINTVFSDGNPDADVMIIGEAPGADEDRIGLAFVGKSGMLLDKMLESVGLSRKNNVYISNILPWRPPGNRTPSSSEVALCLPFIKKHIELVKPKVLVLLGASAAGALLDTTESVSRLRGRWFNYDVGAGKGQIPALVTFHPAFLLRSPLQKKSAWQDMLSLRQKLDNLINNLGNGNKNEQ